MAKPRVFVSSTYVDLKEIRASVGDFLEKNGCETQRFERGGVFYDPLRPVTDSCCKEIKDSDFVVLIIGGRYGSPASDSIINSKSDYNSITKKEYLTARDAGIPIYTFVESKVHEEFEKYYRKASRKVQATIEYAHVDSVQVFRLLDDIYMLKRGNLVFAYASSDDIIYHLKAQLASIWRDYFKEKRKSLANDMRIRINSYKLFFLRSQEGMSLNEFSKKTSVDLNLLRRLEKINKKSDYLEPKMFPLCDREVLEKIENSLNCKNYLRIGRSDDYLSIYIQYYSTYKGKITTKTRPSLFTQPLFPTRAVVFDFDGTLTHRNEDLTTWEKIWLALGYDINDCSNYHREYSEKRISHLEWCNITCTKFREKDLKKSQLLDLAKAIELVPGTKETLSLLHANNVKLYILSGSIKQIIKQVLGELYGLFEEVKGNDLIFDRNGRLVQIRGTKYDFEGKANFLKSVITDNFCSPLEVLFIGNSCNDVWASRSGARTLCINPRFTDPNNVEQWSYCLRRVDDLRAILDFVNLPENNAEK